MRKKSNCNKTWLRPVLFGVMLSLAITFGYQLEKYDRLMLADYRWVLAFIGFAIILAVAYKLVSPVLRRGYRKRTKSSAYTKKEYALAWLFLIACNFVVLLGVYPGFFVYDAQTEVTEVLTRSFTSHHPLLHVLLLGGSVALFHKYTGSYNLGIFAYTLAQTIVMTWIFTYILNYLKKNGAGKRFRRITALFFGVFPTIVMYTLCSSKDGLFAAFLALTVVLIFEWEDEDKASKRKKKGWQIAFAALMFMLFRHNGFYAYLVFAVFALIAQRASSDGVSVKKERASFLIWPLVLYIVCSSVMTVALSAESSEHQEMLTVPIQQLARTYVYEGDDFTAEEKAVLTKYMSEEGLSHYTPRISDILKMYFNNEEYAKDKASFWKLWLDKGKKHPLTYVNAWFLTSYGYWYPGAVINVYQGNTVFTFTYTDSSYFGYEVELPGERHSFIPVIDSFYRKLSIEKFQQNIPVVSLLFSPAAYFWACVFLFMCSWGRGKRGLYPYILPLLAWMTVLLGPTYLVRYVIYLWYIIPVLAFHSTKQGEVL